MSLQDYAIVVASNSCVGCRLLNVTLNLYRFDIMTFVGQLPEVSEGLIDVFHLLVVIQHERSLKGVVLLRSLE